MSYRKWVKELNCTNGVRPGVSLCHKTHQGWYHPRSNDYIRQTNPSRTKTQGGAEVGLQLWVRQTEFILILLFIEFFSLWTTVNLLLPHPVLKSSKWWRPDVLPCPWALHTPQLPYWTPVPFPTAPQTTYLSVFPLPDASPFLTTFPQPPYLSILCLFWLLNIFSSFHSHCNACHSGGCGVGQHHS